MSQQVAIVTPVFDDWDAFAALIAEIARRFDGGDIAFHIVAVDDGSSIAPEPVTVAAPADSCIVEIEVLRLALNLGHQRAIATGLCTVADRPDIDAVIVMDCDGEDRPEDIVALSDASRLNPGWIVLAHRSKRSESRGFRVGYAVYKLLFHALTGRVISFGNYTLLPIKAVRRLVHMPELWNNLPAAIMRSRVPYTTVPTERGQRYAGQSKMNLVSLVVHGLSAMSVYTDMIFVRTLIAASVVAGLSVFGIIAVILIRFVTDLAVPGWTTTVVGNLLIVLLQTVVIVIATSLMMLSGRSNRPIVPIIDAWSFVAERQQRAPQRDPAASVRPRALP